MPFDIRRGGTSRVDKKNARHSPAEEEAPRRSCDRPFCAAVRTVRLKRDAIQPIQARSFRRSRPMFATLAQGGQERVGARVIHARSSRALRT